MMFVKASILSIFVLLSVTTTAVVAVADAVVEDVAAEKDEVSSLNNLRGISGESHRDLWKDDEDEDIKKECWDDEEVEGKHWCCYHHMHHNRKYCEWEIKREAVYYEWECHSKWNGFSHHKYCCYFENGKEEYCDYDEIDHKECYHDNRGKKCCFKNHYGRKVCKYYRH